MGFRFPRPLMPAKLEPVHVPRQALREIRKAVWRADDELINGREMRAQILRLVERGLGEGQR